MKVTREELQKLEYEAKRHGTLEARLNISILSVLVDIREKLDAGQDMLDIQEELEPKQSIKKEEPENYEDLSDEELKALIKAKIPKRPQGWNNYKHEGLVALLRGN